MTKAHALLVIASFASASVAACGGSSGGENGPTFDGGLDGASDGAAPNDAASDRTIHDGGSDALPDGFVDATLDVGFDTGGDAPADAAEGGSSDASDASDAQAEAGTDATLDAMGDAPADAPPPDASGCTTVSSACPAVLLLAGSATSVLGGQLYGSASWSTSALIDTTLFSPSLTFGPSQTGVGVVISAVGGSVDAVTWSAAGGWTSFASLAGTTARSAPSLDGHGGSVVHLVYQDTAFLYDYLAYTGTWSAPAPVGPGGAQSYGPVAASIAARGTDATVAFIDGLSPDVNFAAQQDLTGGTWQTRNDLAGPESFTIAPSIVALGAGPELLTVFVQGDSQVMFATRTSGTWTAAAAVTSATTSDPVAVAALPGGKAILAFRGTDTMLYWSTYASGAWSTVAPFATPNVAVDVSPAVTHGVGGFDAEIGYVSAGALSHARLSGAAWSTPTLVGGSGLVGVAIATAP
jgi:hypothetical protein